MTEVSKVSMFRDEREKGSEKKNLLDVTNPDIEFAYGWNRFYLRLVGLWPEQTCLDNRANFFVRYSPPFWGILVIVVSILPQMFLPFFDNLILEELIQIGAYIVGIIGSVVKIFVLWLNGEVLAGCLSFLIEDWTRKLDNEEREVMLKNAKLGRKISINFGILMHMLVWSYTALKIFPLLTTSFDVLKNSTNVNKFLMYPGVFPLDLSKPKNFALVYTAQFLATVSSTIAYTCSDCFIAMFVIHVCGQFVILRRELNQLLDNETSLEPEIFHRSLANVVKRHETLIKVATVIEDTINLMLLVLTLIYTIQFGLQLFGLMTAVTSRQPGQFPFLQILFYISYLNVTIVHLFLYCYVGDMLMEESEAFGFASYSCKWYNLSGREAKSLILIIHRARNPLQISAGKFVTLSLELFANVLKTSISYFSVLLTMKEQMS